MAAKPEPIAPGGVYHINNCENNRVNLFREERNYPYFISLIEKHLTPIAEIYAFCLMKKLYHLLLRMFDGDHFPKKHLKNHSNLFNAYAKACNKAYGLTGSLFEEHPRKKRIDKESFLVNVDEYIHLNPVEHGFDKNVNTYQWSFYPCYRDQKESFLNKEYVLEAFGGLEKFIIVHHG